eukprot:scaffold138092_cov34-Tisochrysis_lutea.AAC.2
MIWQFGAITVTVTERLRAQNSTYNYPILGRIWAGVAMPPFRSCLPKGKGQRRRAGGSLPPSGWAGRGGRERALPHANQL